MERLNTSLRRIIANYIYAEADILIIIDRFIGIADSIPSDLHIKNYVEYAVREGYFRDVKLLCLNVSWLKKEIDTINNPDTISESSTKEIINDEKKCPVVISKHLIENFWSQGNSADQMFSIIHSYQKLYDEKVFIIPNHLWLHTGDYIDYILKFNEKLSHETSIILVTNLIEWYIKNDEKVLPAIMNMYRKNAHNSKYIRIAHIIKRITPLYKTKICNLIVNMNIRDNRRLLANVFIDLGYPEENNDVILLKSIILTKHPELYQMILSKAEDELRNTKFYVRSNSIKSVK